MENKNIEIIKSYTTNEREKCIKCQEKVNGKDGFVLVRAGFNKQYVHYRYETLRQYPLCLRCWKDFNKQIENDKRDGKKIIEKRIKKTIMRKLK